MSDLMKIGGLLCAGQNTSDSNGGNGGNGSGSNANGILKSNGKDSEIDFDHLKMLSNSGDDSLSKHSLKKPLPMPALASPNMSTISQLYNEPPAQEPSLASGGSNTIISVTSYNDRLLGSGNGSINSIAGKASVSTATNGSGGYSPSSIAPQLSIGSSSASPNVPSNGNSTTNSSTSSSPITGSTYCHPDLTSTLPPLPSSSSKSSNPLSKDKDKEKEEDLNFSQLTKSFINNSFIANSNSNSNSILNSTSNSNSSLNITNKNKPGENVLNSLVNGSFVVSPTSSPPILDDKPSIPNVNNNGNSHNNNNNNNNSNNNNQNIYPFIDEGGSSGELDSIPAGNYDSEDERSKQGQKFGDAQGGEHPVSSRKLWSQEECCQLLELVLKLDPQSFKSKESENRWRTIASELGRTVTSTRKKYMRLMNRWSSSTPSPSFPQNSPPTNSNPNTSPNPNPNHNYPNSIPDRSINGNSSGNNGNDRKRKESYPYDQQHQQHQHPGHQQYHQKVELLPQPYPHPHHPQQVQYHRYNNESPQQYFDGYPPHGFVHNQQQQQQQPPRGYPPAPVQPIPVYQHQHQHQQHHQHQPPHHSQGPIHHGRLSSGGPGGPSVGPPNSYIQQYQHHSYPQQQQQPQQQQPYHQTSPISSPQPPIKRNKTAIPSPSDQPYYFIPNNEAPQPNSNIPLQMISLQQSINSNYYSESNSSPTLSPNPHSSPSQQQSYGFRVISEQLTSSIPFQPKRRPKKLNKFD